MELSELLTYAFRSALCLSLLYVPYRLLMQHETFFRLNRMLLVGIILFSLIMPLVSFTLPKNIYAQTTERFANANINLSIIQTEQMLKPLQNEIRQEALGTRSKMSNSLPLTLILSFIYIIGISVVLIRFIIGFIRMQVYMHQACLWKNCEQGVTIYCHVNPIQSFSWMKSIAISEEDYEFHPEILQHELAHVTQYHSIDNFLMAFCLCIQWYNPFAWLMSKTLSDVHEFEADSAVIHNSRKPRNYLQLLLQKSVMPPSVATLSLVNSFGYTNTKRRITKICQKPSSKWKLTKTCFLIPVLAVIITLLAKPVKAQLEQSPVIQNIIRTVTEKIELPEEKTFSKEKMLSKEPVAIDIYQSPNVSEQEEPQQHKHTISDEALAWNIEHTDITIRPVFPGGDQALKSWLKEHMPDKPENETAERIYIKLYILDDGTVWQPQVLSSVETDVEQQLVSIINSMPAWTPASSQGEICGATVTLPIEW